LGTAPPDRAPWEVRSRSSLSLLELSDVAAQNMQVAERLMGLLRAQCEVDAAFFGRAPGPIGTSYAFDESTQNELKALGYVDDGASPAGDVLPRGIERPNYCGH